MYFFVKDNNMAKDTFELKIEDMQKGKLSDTIMNSITKSLNHLAKDEILETINEYAGGKKETLFEIMDNPTDQWLAETIRQVLALSKTLSMFQSLSAQMISPSEHSEFIEEFRRNTEVTIRVNNDGKMLFPSGTDVIQTSVELTPGSTGPGAGEIFRMLSAVFYGGEFKVPERFVKESPDGNKSWVVNATRGFHSNEIQGAADKLRDWMFNKFKNEFSTDLKEKIKDELSKP